MSRPAGIIGLALIVAATGCGGGGSKPTPGERALASVAADYGKDYSRTTCQQFLTTLTDGQRTAAAAGALMALRRQDNLSAPSDIEVDRFEAGMEGACQANPDQTVAHAAVFVYGDQ